MPFSVGPAEGAVLGWIILLTMRQSYAGAGTSSTMGPAHSYHCNRRYSRIAREIVRHWVIPILKGYSDLSNVEVRVDKDKHSQQLHYSHQEVDTIVHAISEASEDCMLDPRRDVFQYQDSKSSQTAKGFHCGICGKMFMSQYYLDLHMDNRHSHELRESNNQDPISTICPAIDLCSAFGDACNSLACIEGCEKDEINPFDTPDNYLTESRKRCVGMMENCFMNSMDGETASAMTHDLIYHFCFQITNPKSFSYHQNYFRFIHSYPHNLFSSLKSFGNASDSNENRFLFPFVLLSICFIGFYFRPMQSKSQEKSG